MHIFLAETEGSAGGIGALFTALGLNLPALILNMLAFLVIVWVLGKFVYPTLIKALDAKKDEYEAAAQIEAARTKATEQAERLVAEAHEQLNRDILTARKELKSETAKLVAGATGAVLKEKLDSSRDAELINRSLEAK
jgi:F0F1-type ATP synthase membrane subunit b/b'